jgi:hypothetical protein
MADHIPLSPKVKPPGTPRPPAQIKNGPAGSETWKKLLNEALQKGAAATEGPTGIEAPGAASPVRMVEETGPGRPGDLARLGDAELILGPHGGDRRSRNFAPKAKKIKWGETSEYLIARLKRDAPAVAEGLARGEYKSVRQAAIAAGIVKVPTALDQAKRWAGKLGPSDLEELRSYLDQVRAPPDD